MTERLTQEGRKTRQAGGTFDAREAVEKHERKVQACIDVRRGERRVKLH